MRTPRLALMTGLLGMLALPLAAAAGSGGNGNAKGGGTPPAPIGTAPDCLSPTLTVAPQTIVGAWYVRPANWIAFSGPGGGGFLPYGTAGVVTPARKVGTKKRLPVEYMKPAPTPVANALVHYQNVPLIVRMAKGRSSRLLRQEFSNLKSRLPTL